MSLHSRSSSEIETITYGEVLPVFFKDFCKDFDFNDVKYKAREIFLESEYDYIVKESGNAQIMHLLWVLENKSTEFITKFLDLISYEYKWIVDKIKRELDQPSDNTSIYLDKLKHTQFEHQRHTDYNVHRTKPFFTLRSALRKLNPKYGSASVVLLGELGSGKKWLSLDVCSDYNVLKSMNFQIFWIDCINCLTPLGDYNALKTLMFKLKPFHNFDDNNHSSTMLPYMITRLKEQIKHQLESKENYNCLLVLANVPNPKCQEIFNLGCKRLIITRNKKVSESLSKKLNIHLTLDEEGLNKNEFHLLLDKYMPLIGPNVYNWREECSHEASDIFYMSDGDPYMLSIIAKNLQEKKSNWQQWRKDLNNFHIPDRKFIRDIENSLKILPTDLIQLYATLAVFPYCARIPVKLLASLWNISLQQAENIVKKLHTNSFVKKETLEDNDTIVCSLKFVYSSYIKNCAEMQKQINQQELHRKIIEYYEVEKHLDDRKDVDLYFGAQHDSYFFRCIGYHLYGADYKDLFPKLYLDFGFLGQKMRTERGLASIVADFRDYEMEILQGHTADRLLKRMRAFLAKTEEKILHTNDCCLLQYALLAEEPIRELALQQIEKFPHRVWFSENGQFHQRRFIVSLTKSAKHIRILEHDICIVVLFNNDTFLVDISLDSTCVPVQLIDGSSANITDIKTFNHNNHLLTLDSYGHLNLWKIEDEKRRMLAQRKDSEDDYNPNNYKICAKQPTAKPFKQNISIPSLKQILAFSLENPNTSECVLHVALDNGEILLFNWTKQEEFKQISYIKIPTKITNIHSICKILSHYMIMDYSHNSTTMNVTFMNLRNTAREITDCVWPQNTQLIHYEVYDDTIIMVFTYLVVRLTFKFNPFYASQPEELFRNSHPINCAKLCWDNQYLVLGTVKGLVVFDLHKRMEILTSIVGENISCLDNYDLDDNEYKTMIACGIENKNIMYLFGLRNVNGNGLDWEHRCLISAMEKVTDEEQKNTRLLGHKLFDKDDETLYAVDSKNRIHKICCMETKNWSIIPSPDAAAARKITAISAFNSSVFVAFENGEVYDLHQKSCVVKLANDSPAASMDYLKIINDNILITSTYDDVSAFTSIFDIDNTQNLIQETLTKYCAMVMDTYLLIVNNYGLTLFYNTENNFSRTIAIQPYALLADCDLKDNVLFLGYQNYLVRIYSLKKTEKDIECLPCALVCHDNGKESTITCLTASPNAKLFAVGFNTKQTPNDDQMTSCGNIEVYKLDELYRTQLLYCLRSHANPVYDMMFSPYNDILVSISEKICFWNINFILNNPFNVDNRKRHSSRFNSQKSTEEVDAQVMCNRRKYNFLTLDNLALNKPADSTEQSICDNLNDNVFEISEIVDSCFWSSFRGPEDKPELLSCIKLDGNVAKQIFANKTFTQFYTIDDQGVYYNLKLIRPAKQTSSPDSVDFADYSSNSSTDEFVNNKLYQQRLSIASTSTAASGTDVVDDAAIMNT